MASSTPEALWSAPSVSLLRPVAISCADLGRGRSIDRLSLAVPVGMRLLVVSEPEAASSALLRILGGLSRPARGRISIAGMRDPGADGWGRRVAYLGPEPGIRPWMTPRETLELAAALLGLADFEAARRIERALAWARIDVAAATRSVRHGGPPLLQRTGLAAALIGDPEVLLLDEPLRAIEGSERTRMLRLPGSRRTIVIASRYPTSEAGLVTHVALLRGGRIAMIASADELAAAGHPLSMRGISAHAEARRAGAAAESTIPTVAGAR